jgi:hypothetical protein
MKRSFRGQECNKEFKGYEAASSISSIKHYQVCYWKEREVHLIATRNALLLLPWITLSLLHAFTIIILGDYASSDAAEPVGIAGLT